MRKSHPILMEETDEASSFKMFLMGFIAGALTTWLYLQMMA